MRNRAYLFGRAAMGSLALLGAMAVLMAAPSPAAAQSVRVDGRWDAWLGCWEPAGTPSGAKPALLCVVPAQGTSAVDLLTVADGKVTAREHIAADGERVADTRDACTGWRSAQWSNDGSRVYLHSQYTCDNNVKRGSTSLMAMSANGDWMDVQGVQVGRNSGVRLMMYREATDPGTLPAEVSDAIGNRAMAVAAARVAAAAPLHREDIAEASQKLDAPVVEAWLANRGDRMTVDANQLVALANDGVPGSVIDVVVALSYPDKFAVNPAMAGATGQYADAVQPSRLNGVAGSDTTTSAMRMCPYSAYGWDYAGQCAYSPYAYGMYGPYGYYYNPYGLYSPYGGYGYGAYGYNGYGYGGYGYGGYGYGGWYSGSRPVIVVVRNPNDNSNAAHGRLVKGRGYVGGGSSGGSAGSTSQRGSYGGSQSSGGSSSAGSSSGSSGGRTAHKTGGGGL